MTMPPDQVPKFNDYIDLMHAANGDLANLILVLNEHVRHVDLRVGWLLTITLWEMERDGVWLKLAEFRQPVTEGEFRERREEAERKMVPADELAEVLVERDDPEDEGTWEKLFPEKKRELAGLARDGKIKGDRRGRRMLVNAGSFYHWLGEPVPVFPDWGLDFEVFPDDQADLVAMLGNERRRVMELLRMETAPEGQTEPMREQVAETLLGAITEGIRENWRWLLAVETVVGETAAGFGGEDPLLPAVRELLAAMRKKLTEAAEQIGQSELVQDGEPEEERLREVRHLVDRSTISLNLRSV